MTKSERIEVYDVGEQAGAYGNAYSFLGLPFSRATDKLNGAVVIGVPYDLGTSARPGARFGPGSIRRASAQLTWECNRYPWTFDIKQALPMVDYGDIAYRVGDSRDMCRRVTQACRDITAPDNFILTLGGDHFVTYPALQGIASQYSPLALVHFDAHSDTERTDLEFYHGSMFYRAAQDGLIDPKRSVQLGVRTENDSEQQGFTVLDSTWVNARGASEVCQRIRSVVGDLPVYLSIDIDCLDPAFAPGTGTPVVGGLTTEKILHIVRGLCGITLVGADVMEVSPPYDHSDITALAAASIGLDILYVHATGKS